MLNVGASYRESRPVNPAAFRVESVHADGFVAYKGHFTVGKTAVHHFDRDGRYVGAADGRGGVTAARSWHCNLLLGHDLPLSAGERAAWDEMVEEAPDRDWNDFCERYAGMLWTLYYARDREWVPDSVMPSSPVSEFAFAGALHRRRVIEALNTGRRVIDFALKEYPDLAERVRGRVVRNGGYVYRGLDWNPLPHPQE